MSPEQTSRTILSHTLYSTHLAENRTIKLVLPAHPAGHEPLPVIYCHDGGEFLTHGRLATLATSLIQQGNIRPMAIVAISVNKAMRTADYAPDGPRNAAYNRFVVEECLPWVEQHAPVARDARRRFMAGVSLGATASMTLHLQHPALFSQLLLFSGAFYDEALERIQTVPFLDDLHAWMLVGSAETNVVTPRGHYNFYRLNQRAHALLTDRLADVAYMEAHGNHVWGFWQKYIPDALQWVEARLREH